MQGACTQLTSTALSTHDIQRKTRASPTLSPDTHTIETLQVARQRSVTHDSLPILKTVVDAPSAVYSTAADVLASVAFSNIGSLRKGQPQVSAATCHP